jgi:hypothetical protein
MMKYLSRVLISSILLASTVEIIQGAFGIKPTDIDLHQQRIGLWNIEEKVNPALPFRSQTSAALFTINLSDNTIMDEDILKLISMIESHNIISQLQTLNLSNNRLTLAGVRALIPLLGQENFKWLDVSINNLMVSDFHQLWEDIERHARRVSIIEDLGNPEELRDTWAAKVVLLPSSYTVVERFALQPPFVSAHKQYYRLER